MESDRVEEEFERFIELAQSGVAPDPEEFALGVPRVLRPALIRLCREHLELLDALQASSRPLACPDRVGPYLLERALGTGGMATVYQAVDARTGAACAVKILHPHLAQSLTQLKRLEIEHVVGAGLRHEHLIELAEFGEHDGYHYLAMVQVMDTSLAAEIAEQAGRASIVRDEIEARVQRAIEVCTAVGRALHFLHSKNIVHRDVKPQNILLGGDGGIRLSDYGLARVLSQGDNHLTRTGAPIGSPYYMSPEQVRARRFGVDHRTDIYSLGVVLYEMLALRRPFESEGVEQLYYDISFSAVRSPARFNPHFGRDLETICLKAMEKSPRDRYQTALEFVEDLENFTHLRAIRARRPGWWKRTGGWLSRHRVLGSGFGAATVGMLAVIGWHQWQARAAYAAGLPKLSVFTTVPGARVFAREQDVTTGVFGDARELGTTPLKGATCEPGIYRIVVRDSNGSFAELTRWLAPGVVVEVRPSLTAVAEQGGMIRVAGGPFRGGIAEGSRYPLGEYRVAPYFIDKYEVTVEEYRRFAVATGTALPSWWPQVVPATWRRRPATGITWVNARAYAEWAGKRLPTQREWDRAARGVDGRSYPWGDAEAQSVEELACVARIGGLDPDVVAWREAYARHACSVGAHPRDRSPDGVYDILGNAMEWVDAVGLSQWDGRQYPDMTTRCVRGSSFARPSTHNLRGLIDWEGATSVGRSDLGFRCAKSVNPVP